MTELDGTRLLRAALRHVLWIGGPPDAGKTTIADLLADRWGLPVYHFDRHELDHIGRADPEKHPNLWRVRLRETQLEERERLDQGWVLPPVEEMARSAMASWSERVALACEDLLAMPADRSIVAEGPGFFPEQILPLLSNRHHAIWLVPSEEFKRASHERRGKSAWRHKTSDPNRAYRNHVERDLLIAEHYRRTVRARGLPLVEVDGSRSPEEVALEVEAHFRERLAR